MIIRILGILAWLPTSSLAADLHVNAAASPGGDGSLGSPYQTIQEAANVAQAGDTVIIRAGTYRETVTPAQSGTPGHPITFRAHEGETVTINGCDIVTSPWTLDSGQVYKTNVTLGLDHENQIFIHSTDMVWEARWPDVGTTELSGLLEFPMATMDAGTTSTQILGSDIPNLDWSGGKAWVSSHKRWFSWTGDITAHANGQVSVVDNSEGSNMICKEGGKFYLFGARAALDSPNEWFYNDSTNELFLWAPGGGTPTGVEHKARLHGFMLSDRSHIHLQGLKFFATAIQTNSNSDSLRLDGLEMAHVYHSNTADKKYNSQSKTGLILEGTNHELRNSEIAYSSGTGVYLGGSGHRVINNYIHNHDYIGSYASPLVLRGKQFLISHNTITRAGRQCVQLGDIYDSLIQYNRFSFAGYLTWDLGLVYGNSIAGGHSEVRYNWFHDNLSPKHGNGIYYDHNCKNILTHHNVVWNVTGKTISHNQHANYLLYYHNTGSTSGGTALGSAWNAGQQRDLHGCRYINNVFNAGIDFNAVGQTLLSNSLSYLGILNHRHLTPASPPVDAAIPLAGINDQWQGSAPDRGAYEVGGDDWVPGHDFENPPITILTGRSKPRHRNLLINGSFEAGTLEPWVAMAANASLRNQNNRSQWVANGETLGSSYSAQLGSGQTGVSQIITQLEPDTTYRFMGKFRVQPGESARLGVRNHGRPETQGNLITDTITGATPVRSGATNHEWQQTVLTFRTGPNATHAEVYAWKTSVGTGKVWFEDGGVQIVDDLIFAEDFEAGLGAWTATDDATPQATAQSPFNDEGSDIQGAHLQDNASQTTRLDRAISVDPDTTLFVQFDYRFSGGAQNPGFQVRGNGSLGLNSHLTSSSGNFQYKDGDTWMTPGTTLDADAWYRFTYTIEPASSATDRFSVRIQRLSPGMTLDVTHSNLGFQNPLSSFDSIRFHFNVGASQTAGTYHIDNVLVTTSNQDLNLLSDVDSDGIDDRVELAHFGHLDAMNATSDFDADGASDRDEHLAGTDPTDATSRLQADSLNRMNSSSLLISWMGQSDRDYHILWSSNMSQWVLHTSHRGQGHLIQAEIDEALIDEHDGISGNLNQLFLKVEARPSALLPSS